MSKTSAIWTFPKNEGGQESGFHDPGVETFKGNFYRYLARELIQNSIDARHDRTKPVEVKFTVEDILVSAIPDAKKMADALQRCSEYWSENNKRASEFFEQAAALMRKKTVCCLRIADLNTTGICGNDADKKNNWYSLIRCSGYSSKGGGEGGSFGIGKNAPFAASLVRTVFYSTKNKDGETAFQGVAKLTTHQRPEGFLAQAIGYLGGPAGQSIRTAADIPDEFKRTKLGTDIIVLGFNPDKHWQDELVFSVLDNFWPAIALRDLVVTIDKQNISSDNLKKLLEEHAGEDDFTAHQFYRAYVSPTRDFQKPLDTLKDVGLYLYADDPDLPKHVAMVRKSGMVIEKRRFKSPVPFCGVFLCTNDIGNAILRDMEPPRHDEWDADHPEKGANKKTDLELTAFIRQCIKELTPADDSTTIHVPGLSKFLPDDEESNEQPLDGESLDESAESLNKKPKVQQLESRKIDPKSKRVQRDHLRPLDGPEETDPDPTPNPNPPNPKPNPNPPEPKPVPGAMPPIPITYRTFSRNADAGVYAAIVTAQQRGSANAILIVSEIGDDGTKTPAPIKNARTSDGEQLDVRANSVGPVTLSDKRPLKLEIVLDSSARVSMEVEAHAAD